jgi:hypothetical protein
MSHGDEMRDRGPYGLAFGASVEASALEVGAIVTLNGHLVEVRADPSDGTRVELVIVPALGPPPGASPDQREVVISAPRDMAFGTAHPFNMKLSPLPERP